MLRQNSGVQDTDCVDYGALASDNTTVTATISVGQTKTLTGTLAGGSWNIESAGGEIIHAAYKPADISTDTTVKIRYKIAADGDCVTTTDDVTFTVTPVLPCTDGAIVSIVIANDADGINNVCVLDDDNDGVLDTKESNNISNVVNIQTDDTWKKSTVENTPEGSLFNGVSFGNIPNSATFTEDVTIGTPANGTITGVNKIVAPLNKQTYYRKTFTILNTMGAKYLLLEMNFPEQVVF